MIDNDSVQQREEHVKNSLNKRIQKISLNENEKGNAEIDE